MCPLEFRRRDVADRREQAIVVVPVAPCQGRVFDLVDLLPRSSRPDHFGLEQADDAFGERIVVRVADATDGRLDAGFCQPFGRRTTHAGIEPPEAQLDCAYPYSRKQILFIRHVR